MSKLHIRVSDYAYNIKSMDKNPTNAELIHQELKKSGDPFRKLSEILHSMGYKPTKASKGTEKNAENTENSKSDQKTQP